MLTPTATGATIILLTVTKTFMPTKKIVKPEVFTRINSRISEKQHAYIKKLAEKNATTHGEALRQIIQDHIKNFK